MNKTIIIITHVTFDNSPYCSYVHSHAKALARLGYHVIVLAIVKWIPFLSHFQKYKQRFMKNLKQKKTQIDNVDIIYKKTFSISNLFYNSRINFNGIFAFNALKRIVGNIVKNENVILIDAHTFKVEGYVAKKLKEKFKITTFVTMHGTSFIKNLKSENGKKQIKQVCNTVDKVICVSDKLQKYLHDLEIYNTNVIYNGLEQFEVKERAKKKHSIITVASLIPRKNIDLIIKAIGKLKDVYQDITLTIVGEGKEKINLEKLIEEFDVEKDVKFLGQISNEKVQEYMSESYIFLLPSINEGFGIVYPEAMKNGCITIGTKNEGIDGFIKNGENGFLIDPSVDSIIEIINKIFNEEYDVNAIKEKGKNDVKGLTWNNNASNYIKNIN